ncbi:MAG: hypothetical protein ACRDJP_06880 [Actinomycetota bacterium]
MPAPLTEITEIATALGTLAHDLPTALRERPDRLRNVSDQVWNRLVDVFASGDHGVAFATAFANGQAFLAAEDGLRHRPPRLVEWKGPHRPPGDDVVPADIRIDHVYQVSCKYLSKVMHNPGPARLFDRLLVGEERAPADWFGVVAPAEYQVFYGAVREFVGALLPLQVTDLDAAGRAVLKEALRHRQLPPSVQPAWSDLCIAVADASATRWAANIANDRARLRLLWRLLRIGDAPYFILGAAGRNRVRLRVASAWDWTQAYELRSFEVTSRPRGQPEVAWNAAIRERASGQERRIEGHVEIRWSHGRLQGSPEAKVYLDTSHDAVPGYYALQ